MKFVIPWLIGLLLSVSRVRWQPFPDEGENPFLDLIAAHDPILYHVIEGWYYLAPWAAAGRSEGEAVYEGKRGCRSASDFVSHLIAFNSHRWRCAQKDTAGGDFGPCVPGRKVPIPAA